MNKLPIFILIFGLLLVAAQVVGIFWTGEKIRQTDQKVSELAASIEALSERVDSSIQKSDLIDAHVTTGLNAVAQGKWKIVQLPREVQNEAAAVAAIPESELYRRYRAVGDEFDRWYADHYGPNAHPGGDATKNPDVRDPQEPAKTH